MAEVIKVDVGKTRELRKILAEGNRNLLRGEGEETTTLAVLHTIVRSILVAKQESGDRAIQLSHLYVQQPGGAIPLGQYVEGTGQDVTLDLSGLLQEIGSQHGIEGDLVWDEKPGGHDTDETQAPSAAPPVTNSTGGLAEALSSHAAKADAILNPQTQLPPMGDGERNPAGSEKKRTFSFPKNLKEVFERLKQLKPKDWLAIFLVTLAISLLVDQLTSSGRNNPDQTLVTGSPVPAEVYSDGGLNGRHDEYRAEVQHATATLTPDPQPTFTPTTVSESSASELELDALPLSEVFNAPLYEQERAQVNADILEQVEIFGAMYALEEKDVSFFWKEHNVTLLASHLMENPQIALSLEVVANGQHSVDQMSQDDVRTLREFFADMGIYTGLREKYDTSSSPYRKLFSLDGRSDLFIRAVAAYFEVNSTIAEDSLHRLTAIDTSNEQRDEAAHELAEFLIQFYEKYSAFSNKLVLDLCDDSVPEAVGTPPVDMRSCPQATDGQNLLSLSQLVPTGNALLFRGFDQSAFSGRAPEIQIANAVSYRQLIQEFYTNSSVYTVPADERIRQVLYDNPVTRANYYGSWQFSSFEDGSQIQVYGSEDRTNVTIGLIDPYYRAFLLDSASFSIERDMMNSIDPVIELLDMYEETRRIDDLEAAYLAYRLFMQGVDLAELRDAGKLNLSELRIQLALVHADDYSAGFAFWPSSESIPSRNSQVLVILMAFFEDYQRWSINNEQLATSAMDRLRKFSAMVSAAELLNRDILTSVLEIEDFVNVDYENPDYISEVARQMKLLK